MQKMLFFALFVLAPCLATVQGQSLKVKVTGLKNDNGKVLASLFAQAEGFPGDDSKSLASTSTAIESGVAVFEFKGLPPGEYAVSIMHDENGNGKMDTNVMGIPKEGYGASNDPKMRFSAPKFEDSRFRYDGALMEISIKAFYW